MGFDRIRAWPLAAAVLTFAAPAVAADLGGAPRPVPSYAPPPPLAPALAIERWTGFYLGASYGYAEGQTDVAGDSGLGTIDQSGGLATLFGGYNWQVHRIVLGVEADIGGLGSYDGEVPGIVASEIDYFGSVRGRAGLLLTPSLLVYATGGYAWADLNLTANGNEQSQWFDGYQVGGGAELMLGNAWTLRLEYIYTDLASETVGHSGVTNTYDPDFHTVRAGISFKF